MLSLAYFSLGLLIWSILGFWMACQEWPYAWVARARPRWLADAAMYVASGPVWIALDLLIRFANRPKPDRD